MTTRRLRASAVCSSEGRLLVVRLKDPVTGFEAYYPPGGAVERDESPADAARRETLEETGVRVTVEPRLVFVDQYPFCWAGVDYDCTTHYFAATLAEPFSLTLPRVVDAPYNLGASWVPIGEALASLATHPPIATAIARVLRDARGAGVG